MEIVVVVAEPVCAVFLFPNVRERDVSERRVKYSHGAEKCERFQAFWGWKVTEKGGDGRTCGEEEHSHGAVVPSLRPPAEGNQGHQKGHKG